MPLVHHGLCFGCGLTNLFGLMLELEPADAADEVSGRCFIKQDHQGADSGFAHDGVVAAALAEAMALGSGPDARAQTLSVEYVSPAPVGAFLEVHAKVGERSRDAIAVTASAHADGRLIATARGAYREPSG
jgi:acyl-coenzyme A thioesterase PaaI-like protein